MSSSSDLTGSAHYNNQPMLGCQLIDILHKLPAKAALTTKEAALFLRVSVSTMERWRASGDGPAYIQGGSLGAKGTNQSCRYLKEDLEAWTQVHKVTSAMEAAQRRGQTFVTIQDIAVQEEAFYMDERGRVDGMAERMPIGVVMERLGVWDLAWMTPLEAASRPWTRLKSHEDFAERVREILSQARDAISASIEGTELAVHINERPAEDAREG